LAAFLKWDSLLTFLGTVVLILIVAVVLLPR